MLTRKSGDVSRSWEKRSEPVSRGRISGNTISESAFPSIVPGIDRLASATDTLGRGNNLMSIASNRTSPLTAAETPARIRPLTLSVLMTLGITTRRVMRRPTSRATAIANHRNRFLDLFTASGGANLFIFLQPLFRLLY